MNKTDHTSSARAYLEEVTSILTDLPTPAINAAVMRGAGIRLSSPTEAIPGPRRLILDGPTAGQPLASGMTGAALVARQRGNLAYLDARRQQLANDELLAAEAMAHPNPAGWCDHAFEVLDILRVIPLLTGTDFTDAFGELADLAGVEQHGTVWEVRKTGGEWTGTHLDGLGHGFSLDALKAATDANAARFRRWRNALRNDEDGESRSDGISPERAATSSSAFDRPESERPENNARGLHTAALKHHDRVLSADEFAERRRRFPELFSDIAFTNAPAASPATMTERRFRFPELFGEGSRGVDGHAYDDGYEVG